MSLEFHKTESQLQVIKWNPITTQQSHTVLFTRLFQSERMIIHSLEWEDVYPPLSPYHKVGRSSKGRDLFPGSFLWMVTCGVWRCDCHLCGTGPTRINSHLKMLRRRQRRTQSPPQESKVLQVCVPVWSTASFPSETERGTRLRWNRRRFLHDVW